MEEYNLTVYIVDRFTGQQNQSKYVVFYDKLKSFISELNDEEIKFTAILDINENGMGFLKEDLLSYQFNRLEDAE